MTSILIIDDDVTLLTRLAAQLEDAGYTVNRTSDVAHGEKLFAEQRPDLVILEVRTGGGRGWALLERFAAERPVIVLSGAALEEDVVRGFEAGASDYIAKPYRSAELLARLRARLGETQAVPAAPSTVASDGAATSPSALPIAASAPVASALPPPSSLKRRQIQRVHEPDETVFMSEAEEMALLRAPATPANKPPPAETLLSEEEAQRFGPRLRAERLRRHLTLVQLENELRIRMAYLQAIEDEKFSLLPRGPAALEMIRRYAEHLGVDPTEALDEFSRNFSPVAYETSLTLGNASASRTIPRWLVALIAVILALAVGLGAIALFDPAFFGRTWQFFQDLWQQAPWWGG